MSAFIQLDYSKESKKKNQLYKESYVLNVWQGTFTCMVHFIHQSDSMCRNTDKKKTRNTEFNEHSK